MREMLVEGGHDREVQPGCIVGMNYRDGCHPARLGKSARIRAGTIIYADVEIGDYFQTGHHVTIREKTRIGNHVVVGTNTVIDGQVVIGDFVKIESNCYIPTHVTIGSRVFLGPNVTMANDRYPLKMRDRYVAEGPTLEDGVTLGAGVVVCPGVRIGRDVFVAAGSVVTKDVPPETMVLGVPGRFAPLPAQLRERNMALSWIQHLKS
ncbi:MAG TPA: acyltransferase [Syntrophobacter fumaroxidans]|nr:acyltransferase [Syntrophobacter fumaroxidans]